MHREQGSSLWLAVCECKAGTDLTWLLPDSARDQTSIHSESEGHVLRTRLTYRFSLALHEGENLTCVHRDGRGTTEERTVQVPRYRESLFCLKSLGQTGSETRRLFSQTSLP